MGSTDCRRIAHAVAASGEMRDEGEGADFADDLLPDCLEVEIDEEDDVELSSCAETASGKSSFPRLSAIETIRKLNDQSRKLVPLKMVSLKNLILSVSICLLFDVLTLAWRCFQRTKAFSGS